MVGKASPLPLSRCRGDPRLQTPATNTPTATVNENHLENCVTRMPGGHSSAPLDLATNQEEMALASDLPPYRRRECWDTLGINADRPARPCIGKQSHLQHFTAAARADHRDKPLVLPLAQDVEGPLYRLFRQFFYANGTIRRRSPGRPFGGTPARELPPLTNDEPNHDASLSLRMGMSSNGVMSPRPTCFARRAQAGPSCLG